MSKEDGQSWRVDEVERRLCFVFDERNNVRGKLKLQ